MSPATNDPYAVLREQFAAIRARATAANIAQPASLVQLESRMLAGLGEVESAIMSAGFEINAAIARAEARAARDIQAKAEAAELERRKKLTKIQLAAKAEIERQALLSQARQLNLLPQENT